MELTRPVLWAVGILVAILIGVVGWMRTRSVNSRDPLQTRLASHFNAYAASPQSEQDKATLVEGLRSELKLRQVPRVNWRFRLSAAVRIADYQPGQSRAEAIAYAQDVSDIIERLGTSS